MSTQPPHGPRPEQAWHGTARRRVALSVGAVLLGMLAAILTASGAQAHAVLTSMSPADGAQLSSAPTQVVLTFDEPVSSSFATVAVTDASGASVVSGRARVDGAKVTQALKGDLATGKYTVAYRVVSDDGHPVSDKTTFTLTLPSASATTPPSASSATPSTASAPATSSPTSAPAGAASAAGATSDDGPGALPWVLLAAVVVLGAGALALVAARRRRSS